MDPLSLNIDIENHDASRPILPKGEYPMVVVGSSIAPSKATPGNNNWHVELATTEVHTTTKGTELQPGFKLSTYIPLQASDKQIESGNKNAFKDRIALTVDAIFNTKQGSRPAFTQDLVTQAVGQAVKGALSIREAEGTFPESNDLGRVLSA